MSVLLILLAAIITLIEGFKTSLESFFRDPLLIDKCGVGSLGLFRKGSSLSLYVIGSLVVPSWVSAAFSTPRSLSSRLLSHLSVL
jgi:hypothetical protein